VVGEEEVGVVPNEKPVHGVQELHRVLGGEFVRPPVDGDDEAIAGQERDQRVQGKGQLQRTQGRQGVVPVGVRVHGADAGDGFAVMVDRAAAEGEEAATGEVILRQGDVAVVEGQAALELRQPAQQAR
jgi:hypothetical protein